MPFGITAAGLFTNLFEAGLARFGSLAFQKVVRINKIEQEIRAGPTQDTPIARALHDLQIVIGTSYGPYTQELDSFLIELKRSGIISLIAEEAAFSRENPVSKPAFMTLYADTFKNQKQEGEKLFDVIFRCFKVSLSEQTRDQALAFFIRSLDQTLNRSIDTIQSSLAPSFDRSNESPFGDHIANIRKICRGLQSSYKNVRIETNRGARMVDISRVYIASKVRFAKEQDLIENPRLYLQSTIAFNERDMSIIEYKDLCRAFHRVIDAR